MKKIIIAVFFVLVLSLPVFSNMFPMNTQEYEQEVLSSYEMLRMLVIDTPSYSDADNHLYFTLASKIRGRIMYARQQLKAFYSEHPDGYALFLKEHKAEYDFIQETDKAVMYVLEFIYSKDKDGRFGEFLSKYRGEKIVLKTQRSFNGAVIFGVLVFLGFIIGIEGITLVRKYVFKKADKALQLLEMILLVLGMVSFFYIILFY